MAKGKAVGKVQEASAGLFVEKGRQPIPLEGVRVRGRISGVLSRVTVEQRYRNAEEIPVEAVYIFPMPEAAAVDRVVLRIGDRRIEAKVMEREKAFEAYDDALAEGHGALLLDQERPNIFTASLGNLLPGQEVTVEISYAAEVAWEGLSLRFLLPTTVAPRYAPAKDRKGVSPTPAEGVNPPVALTVPYGLDLQVEVDLPAPLRAVESPSHPVRVELENCRAKVSLSKEEVALDRDFVLLVTPSEAKFPWVRVERAGEGRTCSTVALVPQVKNQDPGCLEVVFLVDRSGSMEGSSMEQVRRALQLSLRSLREGDRFDIVGFGSTHQALFGKARPYTQENLDEAARHVQSMDADLGGTEILPALQSVLIRSQSEGKTRQVILLTDGEVTNEEAVLELAAQHARDTRIFVFGIGFGPSEFLVRGLARVTGGAAEFVHPGERMEPKVLRQFARISQPVVTGLKICWGGGKVRLQAPSEPSSLFVGEPFMAYALWEGAGPRRVTLTGKVSGKEVSWSAELPDTEKSGESLAVPLAARSLIREMEEGKSKRGSAREERTRGRVEKEILDLALAYNLVSSVTSMVAVEEREASGDRRPAELRRVPVALTYGWGGSDGVASGPPTMAAGKASFDSFDAPSFRRRPNAMSVSGPGVFRDSLSAYEPQACMSPDAVSHAKTVKKSLLGRFFSAEPAGGPPAPESMDIVVSLQKADGSWCLNRALCEAIGVHLPELKSIVRELGGEGEGAAVATAVALEWLKINAADREVEWKLLAQKAEVWLCSALAQLPGPPGREALGERMAALVAGGAPQKVARSIATCGIVGNHGRGSCHDATAQTDMNTEDGVTEINAKPHRYPHLLGLLDSTLAVKNPLACENPLLVAARRAGRGRNRLLLEVQIARFLRMVRRALFP
jgi:Ca-activated chloride channel family protein